MDVTRMRKNGRPGDDEGEMKRYRDKLMKNDIRIKARNFLQKERCRRMETGVERGRNRLKRMKKEG